MKHLNQEPLGWTPKNKEDTIMTVDKSEKK